MVHIHGGGYVFGNSSSNSGASLVSHSKGKLIHVSIQYRLGPLGFLAGEDVANNGSVNVGILDQRAALDWVHYNIDAFGGDRNKVTIVGDGAGATSVGLHMMRPERLPKMRDENRPFKGNPLPWRPNHRLKCCPVFEYEEELNFPFQAAIMDSPWWSPMMNNVTVNKQYQAFLKAAECEDLRCLRDAPVHVIKYATEILYNTTYSAGQIAYGTYYWGPFIDGTIIREHPLTAFEYNRVANVTVMITRVGNEGFAFSNVSIDTEIEMKKDLEPLWQSEKFVSDTLIHYPTTAFNNSLVEDLDLIPALRKAKGSNISFSDDFARREALFGDAVVNCPTRFIANAVGQRGPDTFKMIFDKGLQIHGAIKPYVYSDNINPSGEVSYGPVNMPGDPGLAWILRDYYVSFAVYKDPHKGTTADERRAKPYWREYYETPEDAKKVLYVHQSHLNYTKFGMIDDPDDNARCRVFHGSPNYKGSI
ncbi:hypothetical protein E8E14_014617 [Neopestalotiopsis sp. 37M]|nr:hypothetical protein E8E14_014617 [Neopestalotiopsis sp. 37M]